MAKLMKRLAIEHTVEDGKPFTAECDFRMDLDMPAGELREVTTSDYLRKGLLIDVTHVKLQAATHAN